MSRSRIAMRGGQRVHDARKIVIEIQADLFGGYDLVAMVVEHRGAKRLVHAQVSRHYDTPEPNGLYAVACYEEIAEELWDLMRVAPKRR